jgi:hypothetical protein
MQPNYKLFVGAAIFITGFMLPLFIPLVAGSSLSIEWKTGLSGFLAIGAPEIFMLIAVAILGKEGYNYLKSKLWQIVRPPEKVGQTQYRIGLLMFFLPIVYGWSQPYLEYLFPAVGRHQLYLAIAGDVIFAAGLYLLGAEFWGKIKALFVQ